MRSSPHTRILSIPMMTRGPHTRGILFFLSFFLSFFHSFILSFFFSFFPSFLPSFFPSFLPSFLILFSFPYTINLVYFPDPHTGTSRAIKTESDHGRLGYWVRRNKDGWQ